MGRVRENAKRGRRSRMGERQTHTVMINSSVPQERVRERSPINILSLECI